MRQPTLPLNVASTAGRARATDRATAVNAARRPRRGLTLRIVQAFEAAWTTGLTDDELVHAVWQIAPREKDSTIKSARSRLWRDGVFVALRGVTRPSDAGMPMQVWALPASEAAGSAPLGVEWSA